MIQKQAVIQGLSSQILHTVFSALSKEYGKWKMTVKLMVHTTQGSQVTLFFIKITIHIPLKCTVDVRCARFKMYNSISIDTVALNLKNSTISYITIFST